MTNGGAPMERVLGPLSATCIVVGAIVGVGIFFTPTTVAQVAGSAQLAMWTWALGGFVALLGALVFAELGGMYGRTGGQYEVLRDAFGPFVAFCFVFCYSTAILPGAAAIIAIICAENIGLLVTGEVPGGVAVTAMAATLIGGLALANVVGVKQGAAIQNVTVFAKVGTLVMVGALPLIFTPQSAGGGVTAPAADSSGEPWLRLLFAALVPALFSFGGWQHALWIGGEIKNPRRNIPLSIIAGVVLVILVYLVANWAYFALLGYEGVSTSDTLAADAVSTVLPSTGSKLIAAAVAFSALGVLNAQLLSGPRLLCGMAQDGRFFQVFARVHSRFKTPLPAILLVGVLGLVFAVGAGKDGVGRLLTGVVFVEAPFFCLTALALVILRTRSPGAHRPFRVPLYPVVPLGFLLLELAIIYGAFQVDENRNAAWIGVCWILAAVWFYLFRFRRQRTMPPTRP